MNTIDFEEDESMVRFTNDLKKKDSVWVLLRNGWKAEIYDNMKGNTRMCRVHGDFDEIGSVYSHDMVKWGRGPGQIQWSIKHTESQLKLKKTVETWEDTRRF